MNRSTHILLIEDDASIAGSLADVLRNDGYEVTILDRGDEGLKRAQQDSFDVVITDLRLPGLSGLDLVRELHAAKPRIPIVLITAHGTTETAIGATRVGAYEYLLKPFEMPELLDIVDKAVSSNRLMSDPVSIGVLQASGEAIIGNSRAMQDVYKEIGRVADKPVTVLIRGETGTGKELVARAIYQHSNRADSPFVAINCAAIPETLLESDLFGHERGAFTGAETKRIGRFEQAHGGTIFLDEIGDMSLNTQAKLLRVLQEKQIERLGGTETIPIDVRLLAATHQDLEKGIEEKRFREDLFYRLSVVVITLPALRDRTEDIPTLINYFLNKYGSELGVQEPSISAEALEFLQRQKWPGNVRELENTVRNALLIARGYTISADDLRKVIKTSQPPSRGRSQSVSDYVAEILEDARRGKIQRAYGNLIQTVEQELFAQAIHLAHGNQAKAARWLGVSRITMREKLTLYGLHPSQEGTEN